MRTNGLQKWLSYQQSSSESELTGYLAFIKIYLAIIYIGCCAFVFYITSFLNEESKDSIWFLQSIIEEWATVVKVCILRHSVFKIS